MGEGTGRAAPRRVRVDDPAQPVPVQQTQTLVERAPTEHVPDTEEPDHTRAVPVRDAVARALGALTAKHREVLVLRYFLDLTETETAHVLGIPLGTVKSRHARALTALAETGALQDLDPQEERA